MRPLSLGSLRIHGSKNFLLPNHWAAQEPVDYLCFIVLFGPTLAAMCKQCAIPVSQKAGKQRSLFDSGEVAVTSLCHSRASRLWVWLYKRETSKIACKDELDLEDALEVQLDTCP